MNAANSTAAETVFITGASSGIGRELAKYFAADKSTLILSARNVDALEKLAAELRETFSIQVHVLPADLSLPETPKKIFSELQSRGLNADVLVNNAGFGLHEKFVNLPLPRQLEIIQVNVTALVELTGLFLPEMLRRRRGGVLNVSSVAGFLPGPNMAVYYASKAFVTSLTEALAEELSGSGLHFSALCPGPTESNFGKVARGGKTRRVERKKMSAQTVAQFGHKKFRANQLIAIPGMANKLLTFAPRLASRSLARKLVKSYNKIEV